MNLLTTLQKLNKLNVREQQSREIAEKLLGALKKIEGDGGAILKCSKEATNFAVNGELTKASRSLKEAYAMIVALDKSIRSLRTTLARHITKAEVRMGDLQSIKLEALESDFQSAKEEFLEAKILIHYLATGKILSVTPDDLVGDFMSYAGALSDFCGELVRTARLAVIKDQFPATDLKHYYATATEIYATLSNFAFSNKSGMRNKLEQLKQHISRLEDILYSLPDVRCQEPFSSNHLANDERGKSEKGYRDH